MTRQKWLNLTEKQRWDVMVALRGPDIHKSTTLKWYTTAVIRAQVFPIIRCEGGSATVNDRDSFVVVPNYVGSNEGTFDLDHFIGHIHKACEPLDLKMVKIPWEAYQAGLREDIYHAAKRWMAALMEQNKRADYFIPTIREGENQGYFHGE